MRLPLGLCLCDSVGINVAVLSFHLGNINRADPHRVGCDEKLKFARRINLGREHFETDSV